MAMEIRLIDKVEDLPIMQQWAGQYGHVLPHVDCLPGVGAFVQSDEGEPLGGGFLYLANDCPVAFIEFAYVEPSLSGKLKKEVLCHIYDSLEGCAIAEEHPFVIAGSPKDSVTRMLSRKGWIPSAPINILFKNVKPVEG